MLGEPKALISRLIQGPASEIAVPGSLGRCIRVLLHVNTERSQADICHVYLNEAKRLRPDVTSAQ